MPRQEWDFKVIDQFIREKATAERRDITDQEVIEVTGISRATFYRYIREDIKEPSFHIVEALCKYFGKKPEDFKRKRSKEKKAGETVGPHARTHDELGGRC